MAVVGDVKKTQILPLVKKLFGDFRPSSKGLPPILPEPPLEGPRRAHMERQGAQTHLIIGYLGVGLKSKDNAAMALIETALSGQGGRLFLQLRDKESLAYSVTAFRRPGLETGLFGVYIACHPTKLAPARAGIFRELERLKQQGISQSELTAAKKYLMGNLQIDLQTNRSQAMHMALDELYGLGYGHIHDFIRAVEAVTEDDIKRVARKIIRPRGFVQVTTGPHRTSQKKRGSI
jgi:zinc protease